jgi:hypothetical protein
MMEACKNFVNIEKTCFLQCRDFWGSIIKPMLNPSKNTKLKEVQYYVSNI